MKLTFLSTIGDEDTPVEVEASFGVEHDGLNVAIESVTDADGASVSVPDGYMWWLREQAVKAWRASQ